MMWQGTNRRDPCAERDAEQDDHDRMLHLQRMANLGTLAGGLGHDLRNLVMPILLRLDALTFASGLSESTRADLAGIRHSITHIRRLSEGLRLLSSDPLDQRREPQRTDLHDWWTDLRAVVSDTLSPGAELSATVPAGLPRVCMPPAVLAQVVVNIMMNARRALLDTAAPCVTIVARAEPGAVVLSIHDNGVGMDAETRRRCFDAYFTTHPREFSSGLGLSMSRGLMHRYGGDLTLELGVGAGATFLVRMVTDARDATMPPRRVRLDIRDPRRRMMVQLLVDGGPRHVTRVDLPESADMVICDAEAVSALMTSPPDGAADATGPLVIVIGDQSERFALPAHVQWIDINALHLLEPLLF